MTERVFAPFDQIRVINLPERTDRRRETMAELAAIGLADDPRVSFFPAIRPDDSGDFTSIGARGVYLSQQTILRDAARDGASVLVLEDDVSFTTGAGSHDFGKGWDVYYGGYYAADPDDLAASDIIGAHMMGFSASGAHRVSAALDALTYEGIHPPIDAAYIWIRRADPSLITAFAVPPLANQRSSRSDIADLKFFDRLPVIRDLAGWWRQTFRR